LYTSYEFANIKTAASNLKSNAQCPSRLTVQVRLSYYAETIEIKFLTVATLVGRNANKAMVAPMVGSGGVCVWRESGFRRCENVSTLTLLYKEIL
jgi:phosphotransferase system IIB component